MNRKTLIILSFLSFAALIIAIPRFMPYEFYKILRWLVSVTAVLIAYKSNKSNMIVITILAILIAILFNPIEKIHLNKNCWLFLDPLTAIFFAVSIYIMEFKNAGNRQKKVKKLVQERIN